MESQLKAAQQQAASMCEVAMTSGRNVNSKIISDLVEENKKLKTGLCIDTSFQPTREVNYCQSARYQTKAKATELSQYKLFSPSKKGKNTTLRQLEGTFLNMII